jgi:small subunit ribosomal protein S17
LHSQKPTGVRFFSSIETEYQAEISDIVKRQEERQKRKQALVGVVVSTKCAKSVTVRVIHQKLVSKYNKFVNVQTRVMAHDEEQKGQLGDLVRIVPCRPMSRKKRHTLMDIVRRPKTVTTEDGTVLSSAGNVSKR